MVSMMDEMQKTLARRRAKVERVEDVSRFLSSLLDNSPNYLVGYVIQKRLSEGLSIPGGITLNFTKKNASPNFFLPSLF